MTTNVPGPEGARSDENIDHVIQDGRWQFDDDVTDVFDNMLMRSIPQYREMRELCWEVGRRFISSFGPHLAQSHTPHILDMGASRGEAIAPYVETFGAQARFTLCEVSEPMLKVLRARYAGWVEANVMAIKNHDLRQGVPSGVYDLVLCVLTLQFTPIEYRRRILESVAQSLRPGGALILVEKVYGRRANLDRLMADIYRDLKRQQGYSDDEIERKRMALEGVLVPLDAGTNYTMLYESGFTAVESFWRWINFAGWVAVK